MAAWRLILDAEASGPWNMGVDEALLDAAIAGGPPSVRFYAWRGPWLSLGYAQPIGDARRAACAAAGVGVVRRATGGRAVLHGGDLTYALAAPTDALPGGLGESYRLVSDALCEALRSFGVPAQRQGRSRAAGAAPHFDCFAQAATDEICVDGRKLVGSAQRRTATALLQHGSIRVEPDPPEAVRAAGGLPLAATCLRELGLGESVPSLRRRCAEALARALGARFELGVLSAGEREQAGRAARRREAVATAGRGRIPAGISRVTPGNR